MRQFFGRLGRDDRGHEVRIGCLSGSHECHTRCRSGDILRHASDTKRRKATGCDNFAAVDFAFSLSKSADYSAIVVVGVDCDHNYYVVDIDRFKTNKVLVYFEHITNLHARWHFRKLRAETTMAQDVIVEAIKVCNKFVLKQDDRHLCYNCLKRTI